MTRKRQKNLKTKIISLMILPTLVGSLLVSPGPAWCESQPDSVPLKTYLKTQSISQATEVPQVTQDLSSSEVALKYESPLLMIDIGDKAGRDSEVQNPAKEESQKTNTLLLLDHSVSKSGMNQPPVIKPIDPKTIHVGEVLRFRLEASDQENNSLNYQEVGSLPKGAVYDELTGEFEWRPSQEGDYKLRFLASDGLLLSAPIEIKVSVKPNAKQSLVLNHKPVTQSTVINLQEDEYISKSQLTAQDQDHDKLTYRLVQPPVNGTVYVKEDGSFGYLPRLDFSGWDSFQYRVSDGIEDSEVATVTFKISPINDAPEIARISNQTLVENTISKPIQINLSDVDSSASDLIITAASSNGLLVTKSGMVLEGSGFQRFLTLRPRVNSVGKTAITITVSDGVSTQTKTFDLTVTPDTAAPEISDVHVLNVTDTSATFEWTTNEKGNSFVDSAPDFEMTKYRSEGDYGQYVFNHRVTLNLLSPGTSYYFRVFSEDIAGNRSLSSISLFTTKGIDTTAPKILYWDTKQQGQDIKINWVTDEMVYSQIEYGPTELMGNFTPLDSKLSANHSVVLSSLNFDQKYFFRIYSKDQQGNTSVSSIHIFLSPPNEALIIDSLSIRSDFSKQIMLGWMSSKRADFDIDYGTSTEYGSTIHVNADRVTGKRYGYFGYREIILNLSPNTVYHFRIRGRTALGMEAVTPDQEVKTLNPDPLKLISGFVEDETILPTEAKTAVETNLPVKAKIEYGFTEKYGNFTDLSSSFSSLHTITMKELIPETIYHYRVIVEDELGNSLIGEDKTFKTLPMEIRLSQFDSDYTRDGFQIFQDSSYSKITYSAVISNADVGNRDWKWSYRLNGGPEVVYASGSGLHTSAVVDYHSMEAGIYEWMLQYFDGEKWIQTKTATEVLAGSWAASMGASIFLDFNGNYISKWAGVDHYETPAVDLDGDPGSFGSKEILEAGKILLGVAEKFSPFNIGVTLFDLFLPRDTYADRDEESKARYDFYEKNHVIQVAIGDMTADFGVGYVLGIAEAVGSYASSLSNLVMNFTNGDVEVIAHEVGHALGLFHESLYDSSGNQIMEYYDGKYLYPSVRWFPIMGNGGGRATWWNGEGNMTDPLKVDEMAIIASRKNGFGYRPDDHGDSVGAASAIQILADTVTGYGIVNKIDDADYFDFTTTISGEVSFTISPPEFGMLDAIVEIRGANGELIQTVDEEHSAGPETIRAKLEPGTYYLVVKSHGRYGDVGQYRIYGKVPFGTSSIKEINALNGNQDILLPIFGVDPIFSD